VPADRESPPSRATPAAYARALLHLLTREPLVAFVLLGGAIFGLYAAAGRRQAEPAGTAPGAPPDRTIHITAADVETLRTNFRLSWKREPSLEEVGDLIETLVNEEVLFREGRALQLDRDDGVVRRRIIEKMTVLARPIAPSGDPGRDELRRWYELYPHRFRRPAQVTFEQRFFDPKKRPDAVADARAALAALGDAGAASPSALKAGDEFLLPRVMEDRSELQVAHLYGQDFEKRVQEAPLGRWTGPVASSFGQHLIYVSKRQAARLPSFEEAEKHVRADWLTVSTRGVKAAATALLPQYRLSLEGPEAGALEKARAVAPLLRRP
jgi:hypothetical protein